MAVKIQPVQIWSNGQMAEAKWLDAICQGDNLSDAAKFNYQLCADDNDNIGNSLASGSIMMNEPEYSQWTTNEFAYNYIADQLSLTIIS